MSSPSFLADLVMVTALLVSILASNHYGAAAQSAPAAPQAPVPAASQDVCTGSLEFLETSFAHQQSGLMRKSADQIAAEWDKALPQAEKTPGKCGKSAEDLAFLKTMFKSKYVAHARPCANIIQMGGTKKWFFGSETDGAKFICYDYVTKGNCVVYSLGSRMDFSFESDVVEKLQCQVHTFDCTVGNPGADELPRGVTFHPWCIGGQDELKPFHSDIFDSSGQMAQYYTMSTVMRLLGHTYVDILKMDIERFEFPVLKTLACPGCFGQANIEFHLQNVNGLWGQAVSYKEWNDVWNSVVCENGLRPFSYDNADCDCCCEYSFLSVSRAPNALNDAAGLFVQETSAKRSFSSPTASSAAAIIIAAILLFAAVRLCQHYAARLREKRSREAQKRAESSSSENELENLLVQS